MSFWVIAAIVYGFFTLVAFRPVVRYLCSMDSQDGKPNYEGGWGELVFLLVLSTVGSLGWPIWAAAQPFKLTSAESVARAIGGESREHKRERKARENAQAIQERKSAHLELVKSNSLRSLELGVIDEDEHLRELANAEKEFALS